jgi:DNA-binding MarR family transcriptional regulator
MLLRKLLHAYYWVDDGLQAHMEVEAGFSLPRAQSMIMACLADGIRSQSEMAAQLRVSKQAVQQALRSLVTKGLVTIRQDPDRGRHRIVELTPSGRRARDVAQAGVRKLDLELGRRIGRERLGARPDAQEVDGGPAPPK